MHIPCDKTFWMVPYVLTLWSWSLAYFWKTLTSPTIFHTRRHRAFIFHVSILSNNAFDAVPYYFTLWTWPWKNSLWKQNYHGCYLISDGCLPVSMVVVRDLLLIAHLFRGEGWSLHNITIDNISWIDVMVHDCADGFKKFWSTVRRTGYKHNVGQLFVTWAVRDTGPLLYDPS